MHNERRGEREITRTGSETEARKKVPARAACFHFHGNCPRPLFPPFLSLSLSVFLPALCELATNHHPLRASMNTREESIKSLSQTGTLVKKKKKRDFCLR